jgi:hypothetical protein
MDVTPELEWNPKRDHLVGDPGTRAPSSPRATRELGHASIILPEKLPHFRIFSSGLELERCATTAMRVHSTGADTGFFPILEELLT